MNTPPLTRRVVVASLAVMALVTIGLEAFVYVSFRARLLSVLDERLGRQTELARNLQVVIPPDDSGLTGSAALLAAELGQVGVDATVLSPDGASYESLPGRGRGDRGRTVASRVRLPGGMRVTVRVSTEEAAVSLRRLLALEAAGTAVALIVAAVVLARVSKVALRPLDQVATTARRTAAGLEGERLRPDRVDTPLGRMAVAFDDMLDSLELALNEARASKDRSRIFLADAAHQLRTPIAGLRASAETLLMGVDEREQHGLVASMVREASRASRTMTGLLTIARLDAGQRLTMRPTDIARLCCEEAERAQSLSPNLAVVVAAAGAPSMPVELDPEALREALGNLLDNARRHAMARIDLSIATDADEVVVRLGDDGAGMDEATAARAFERFASLDGRGGSGLGLAIARGLVEAHGGSLVYRDRVFELRLPTRGAVSPARPPGVPAPPG